MKIEKSTETNSITGKKWQRLEVTIPISGQKLHFAKLVIRTKAGGGLNGRADMTVHHTNGKLLPAWRHVGRGVNESAEEFRTRALIEFGGFVARQEAR